MRFGRVLCGVDASEESREAARQGARLLSEGGRLVLVAVAELEVAAQAGFAATMVAEELEQEAAEALEQARAEVAPLAQATTRLLTGPVPATLLEEVERERADLLCLGTRGHGLASGLLLARPSTSLLHDAPCAVLIARRPDDPGAFPSRIVVGVDGSECSAGAEEAAAQLSSRFGATLRRIAATGGKHVDLEALRARGGVELVEGKPVDALVEASAGADLLVLGSRGRHGLRALGSVSERVAHHARCSVLVVRARG
jgi:nucleotide-binding universal stress UspA family protein